MKTKADIARYNGSAKRRRKVAAIEAEFDEPFWDVVQGFADMGYGKGATARAIGYTPTGFYRIVRQEGQHIRWPALKDMAFWRERQQ
jgi:hypothetical protein